MPRALKQVDLFDTRELKALRDEAVGPPAEPTRPPAWATSVAPGSAYAVRNKDEIRGPAIASAPVLILGGTGAFGRALAGELVRRGQPVRLIVRDGPRAWQHFGSDPLVKMLRADATDSASIARAAEGCEAIVLAVNAGASQRSALLQRSLASALAAAERQHALIMLPGDTSMLANQAGRPLPDGATGRPIGRQGTRRAELENALRSAADAGRCRALVLRMGDAFGPTVRNALVDGIFLNALRGVPMIAYGHLGAAHQWAYMPDVARVASEILLMARSPHAFDGFEIINAPGHIVRPQRAFYEAVAKVVGYSACHIKRRSWLRLTLQGITSAESRAWLELRPQFDKGVLLDDGKITRIFSQFEPTPLLNAIDETVRSYAAAKGNPRVL